MASAPASKHRWTPRLELLERLQVRSPHHILRLGQGRHDVGGLPAAGHDAVDLVARLEVLAKQAHGHLGDRDRIGGVHAEVRRKRRVRVLAVEPVAALAARQRGEDVALERAGVHHHREMHAVEGALLGHEDLAAPAFLGRRAVDTYRDPEVVRQPCEADAGADG